jgi:hypothetical protein
MELEQNLITDESYSDIVEDENNQIVLPGKSPTKASHLSKY